MFVTNEISMLEATRGIFDFHGRPCSSMVYAVKETDGVTLIDTGFPCFGTAILQELQSSICKDVPLKAVLLTHSDLDHMGNAALLQQKTDCSVWINRPEMEYIEGSRKRIKKKQQMIDECGLEVPKFSFYPENGKVGNFTAVETPGHTVGHVSILYKNVVFGGDLFLYVNGNFTHASPEWTDDLEEAERSFAKLCKYPFTVFCPAHGVPGKRKNFFDAE